MAATVRALLEVPEAIVRGLAERSMARRGGVIQWATGTRKGEVVAWLREVGGLGEQLRTDASLAPQLAEQLSRVGIGVNAVLAAQVMTLAVTAVGFAIINQRIKALDRKLDDALRLLGEFREDVAWLDRRLDVAAVAKLTAALDMATWADGAGRREVLPSVRARLVESEHHFAQLTDAMLKAGRAHANSTSYAGYYGMVALAGVARAQLEGRLDGTASAVQGLLGLRQRLAELRERFQKPIQAFDVHARTLVLLGDDARVEARAALDTMQEIEARVAGYESEMSFCAREGLSFDDWRQIGAEEDTPWLLILQPPLSQM